MSIYELPLEMLNPVTKFRITITDSILRHPIPGKPSGLGALSGLNFSKESKTVQVSFRIGKRDISGKA